MSFLRDLVLREANNSPVDSDGALARPDLATLRDIHRAKIAQGGRNDPDWGNEPHAWHPSGVSYGVCNRLVIMLRERADLFKKAIEDKQPDVGLQKIFDLGHAIHWLYQNRIYGPMGILYGAWTRGREIRFGFMPGPEWIYRELPVVNRERNIVGHIDGVVVVPGFQKVLVDFKSKNSYAFKFLTQASEAHIKQLQMYMDCVYAEVIRWRFNDEILEAKIPADAPVADVGSVLYVNKDTGEEIDFPINKAPEVLEPLYAQLIQIDEAQSQRVLPRRAKGCSKPTTKQAKGCVACTVCFELNSGENAFSVLEVYGT